MRQILAVPSQLGPLLRAARKQARLSQEDLASRIGISQSRMSHMELNPGSINLEQLLTILGALGLEIVIGSRPGSSARAPQVVDGDSRTATLAGSPGADSGGGTEW